LKKEEDSLRVQIEQANAYDLNKAAQLKYGQMEVAARSRSQRNHAGNTSPWSTLLREQLPEADIAEIVAKWTGIPVNRLLESERQNCCN